MAPITRAEIDQIREELKALNSKWVDADSVINDMEARMQTVEKESAYTYKAVVIGNGDAPLREIGRNLVEWMKQNKDIPDLVRSHEQWFKDNKKLADTVDRQGRWIENVNWIARAILLVLIGILATNVWNIVTHPPPIP